MKNANKSLLLLLVLCAALILSACGGGAVQNSTDANYKVTVVDGAGVPYTTGVIVQFLQNGQQAAMQVINENGVAEKTLPKGEYTVALMFTGDESEYHYDDSDLTLSAEKTQLQIILSHTLTAEGTPLFADGKECVAYPVSEGSTYVKLIPGERNYFLYAPSVAGMYEFSVSDAQAQLGYYGTPHFVQSQSVAEVVDNAFSVSIKASMIGAGNTGTTVLVIGIDAGEMEGTTLTIQRTGEPEHTLDDEPWMIYQKTVELAPYTLPAGAQIGEFDLTAASDAYNLVLNEQDGFYHLDTADGPLVLVRLGEKNDYLDSFKTILERSGVVKYFFDENGEFIKKESYSECLLEYIQYMDGASGMYPLTEDLKYIIQQRGDHSGWWDTDGALYLFVDEAGNRVPGINPDVAWLFMCCYIAAE